MTEPVPARPLVFVDTETTGLHPGSQMFELAWKCEGPNHVQTLIVPHTLYGADPKALEVNKYRERGIQNWTTCGEIEVDAFRRAATNATLVMANPVFDVPHLMELIGFQVWHYRLIDVESYAMPILGYDNPPSMRTIFERLTEAGHRLPEPDHTAGRDVEALEEAYYILRGMAEQMRQAVA